jgi:hypothetical protein
MIHIFFCLVGVGDLFLVASGVSRRTPSRFVSRPTRARRTSPRSGRACSPMSPRRRSCWPALLTANFSAGLDVDQVRATSVTLSRLAVSTRLVVPRSLASVSLFGVSAAALLARPVEFFPSQVCDIVNSAFVHVDLRITVADESSGAAAVSVRDSTFVAGRLTVESSPLSSVIDLQRINATGQSFRLAGANVTLTRVASNSTALYRFAASHLAFADVRLFRSSLFPDDGARVPFKADAAAGARRTRLPPAAAALGCRCLSTATRWPTARTRDRSRTTLAILWRRSARFGVRLWCRFRPTAA